MTYHPIYHGVYPGAISARCSSMFRASLSVPNSVLYGKNWHGDSNLELDKFLKSRNPKSVDRLETSTDTTGCPVYA